MSGRGRSRGVLSAFNGVGQFKIHLPRARPSRSVSSEALRRLQWMRFYETHAHNASLTCRHFAISRDTFYRWRRRYDPSDLSTLEDRSRAPHHRRRRTTPLEVERLVLRLRDANPGWSKYKIAHVALRDHGVTVSPSTAGRVLTRFGRIDPKKSARRRRAAKHARSRRPRELVASMPGDLVQIDTKHLYWPGNVRRFQFVAIDLATRFKVSEVFTTASSRSAACFLDHALARFPFPVSAVQTDNGSEYLGEFSHKAGRLGIAHFFSYPHCPKHNAVVERQIQTEIEEFHMHVDVCYDVEEFNDLVVAWDRYYNEVRPHQALGYLTPMAYLHHKTDSPRP